MSVEKEINFIKVPLEGDAVEPYKGLYYVIGLALTAMTMTTFEKSGLKQLIKQKKSQGSGSALSQ